ncbi:MAG: hypothetical protein WBO10_12705 [Pyrinomonadaceae bacterium]
MKRSISVIVCLVIFGAFAQAFGQASYPFPPAPLFSDMLLTVNVGKDGYFRPLRLRAFFFAEDKGSLKVLHKGSEIAEYSFRSEIVTAPRYEISGYEIVKGKNDPLGLMLKEPGSYELAYYSGGKVIYRFPFELRMTGGSDPYNPQKTFLIDGDWNTHAYLNKTSTEPHGKWEFRIWMRNDEGGLEQTGGHIRLIRDKDKKLIAVGASRFRTERRWTMQTFVLEKPGKQNPKGEYYDNQDMLANSDKFDDGAYTLNYYKADKLYGTYKFNVAGGNIQPQGRQVRESTDAARFIEGGGKEFWLVNVNK